MSTKEIKEDKGSLGFATGNVVGCFYENGLVFSKSIHLLRCGPSALAPLLPGLPWSLPERRLEKQLAQGNGLTRDDQNDPSGLTDPV